MNRPVGDPDSDDAIAAGIDRGAFATIKQAQAELGEKRDESIVQADQGELYDLAVVGADLREGYDSWPRAAE